MSSNGPVQGDDNDTAIPIDELVINGPFPEGLEAPKLVNGRMVLSDGTQFEMTNSGGRWLDFNGGKIEPHQPFQTNQGLFTPSVTLEDWKLISQSLEALGEEDFLQEEE